MSSNEVSDKDKVYDHMRMKTPETPYKGNFQFRRSSCIDYCTCFDERRCRGNKRDNYRASSIFVNPDICP